MHTTRLTRIARRQRSRWITDLAAPLALAVSLTLAAIAGGPASIATNPGTSAEQGAKTQARTSVHVP